ncbi:hypothetical protein [Terrisporobacter glycolicus]|uniref:hypothetical protein n=1 Tax=Terrisporobacter glycolicus TaxID=36841 RepID=UPI00346447FB
MWRPSTYAEHNSSLGRFEELFNNCSEYINLIIKPIEEETFEDDGCIVDLNTGKEIIFDWEKRERYFSNGHFKFTSLGQFERKIRKPQIHLSLQCDSTDTAVAVGWHSDWLRENRITLNLATDYEQDEYGTVRYTKSFKVYKYENIKELKAMIQRALDTNSLDKSVF